MSSQSFKLYFTSLRKNIVYISRRKIERMNNCIFITNQVQFVAEISRFLCRTIAKIWLNGVSSTYVRAFCPTEFADFYRCGINDKNITQMTEFGTDALADIFYIIKKFSSSFIIITTFNFLFKIYICSERL